MDGFILFDQIHITWLFSIMIFILLMCFTYHRISNKRALLVILSLCLFLGELTKQIYLLATHQYTYWSPPLHLCGLGIFICGWYAFSPNRINSTLLFSLTLPGAMVALIFPGWTYEEVGGFIHIHSFLFHTLLVVFVFCPLLQFELKVRFIDLWTSIIFLITIVPLIYQYNLKFHTNFMFLNQPVENTPLDLLYSTFGSSGYLASLSAILVLIWCVQYSLYRLIQIKKVGRVK